MDTSEIIAALKNCDDHAKLVEIRTALESQADKLKADFIEKATAMGLACHDDNGKPKRKRRANAHKEPE